MLRHADAIPVTVFRTDLFNFLAQIDRFDPHLVLSYSQKRGKNANPQTKHVQIEPLVEETSRLIDAVLASEPKKEAAGT